MHRPELLDWVRRLGAEFRRREMDEHLRPLRVYYLALREGLTDGKLDVSWDVAHTRMWLQALRLPPFENALPTRAPGSNCPQCRPLKIGAASEARPAALRRLGFPGGARVECLGCKAVWLEGE